MKDDTMFGYARRAAANLLILVSCCAAACEKKEAPAPAASVSVAPVASAPKPPEVPWHVGSWTGTYQAERQSLDASKHEAIAGWQQDDGGVGSGSGKIEVRVADNGSITGSSSGPLGELDVTGEVSGETLRVQLIPQSKEPAQAFQGFVVASRSGDKIEGHLQVSTGDGNLVRKGAVTLSKKAP